MIIPSGFSQVNLQFTGTAHPTGAEVTFGVDNNGSLPDVVGNGVANALASSGVQSNFITTSIISMIHVKNGPNATGPFSDVPVNLPGGTGTAGTSPNVAALIKKSTNLGGRRGQGRCFWPGVAESQIAETGIMLASFLIALQTDLNSLLSDLVTEGFPMVLLHNDATAPDPVIGFTVQTIGATQRRRMRR